MRSSHALPSSIFRHQIPGLSDLGHFLISTRLFVVDRLRYATCGAGTGPFEEAYDVFARVFSSERTPDETLIGTTIPSLVAEAAEEYRWLRFPTLLSRPLEPHLLAQVEKLVATPIARWTAHMRRTSKLNQPLPVAAIVAELKLNDLPMDANGEPQDVDACRAFRVKAIEAYKKNWRTATQKVTDADIARECGWRDRTYIGKFKRCDPNNTLAVNMKIWRVLRSTSTPRFTKAGTSPK
jgi:hypothetical protein